VGGGEKEGVRGEACSWEFGERRRRELVGGEEGGERACGSLW
jgi:hypothetical protein